MKLPRQHTRRIVTDSTGYLLIMAALATGWLPGPGGIPLLFAGLGLLSIHNRWARRLRQLLMRYGARLAYLVFPEHVLVQMLYDGVVIAALSVAGLLLWMHHAYWQLAAAGVLVGTGIAIGLLNRRRYERVMRRLKHKL